MSSSSNLDIVYIRRLYFSLRHMPFCAYHRRHKHVQYCCRAGSVLFCSHSRFVRHFTSCSFIHELFNHLLTNRSMIYSRMGFCHLIKNRSRIFSLIVVSLSYKSFYKFLKNFITYLQIVLSFIHALFFHLLTNHYIVWFFLTFKLLKNCCIVFM